MLYLMQELMFFLKDKSGDASIHCAARCDDVHFLRSVVKTAETTLSNAESVDCTNSNKITMNSFINMKNVNDETALFSAVRCNQINNVDILIHRGCDVNVLSRNQQTALSVALFKGFDEIAEMLLIHGADMTGYHFWGNSSELRNMFRNSQIIDTVRTGHKSYGQLWLVASTYGCADINKQNKHGYSPLLWATKMFAQMNVSLGNLVSEILKLRPNLNLQTSSGITALMFIAGAKIDIKRFHRSVNKSLLLSLISRGADVNIRDNENRLALTHGLMVDNINSEIIETLLHEGADPVLKEKHKFLLKLWLTKKCSNDNSFIFDSDELLRFFLCNGFVYNMENVMPSESLTGLLIRKNRLYVIKYLMANCCLGKADFQELHSQFGNSEYPVDLSKDSAVFEQAMHQPWPLVKLAFIAASTLLGDGHKRISRVKETLLPESIQEMLLFQTPVARLPVSQWSSIPLCFDPSKYETLSCPRPLLYYWPLGSVQLRWDK
ncbi:hypothetical protein Btru_056237 [Bulinus truncatus]|nr:hypothetical protein Btru_056237 [Bulinus truncatus]